MPRRDGAALRKERMTEIAVFIQKNLFSKQELSLSQTLAFLEYETGLTEEKIILYLKILEKTGRFIIDEKTDNIKKITESDSNDH